MPSRREIDRAVKKYQSLMGFGREVAFTVFYHDHKKNPLPGKDQPYGVNDSQPQYRRCHLSFDLTHPAWKTSEHNSVANTVRHEMAHYVFAKLGRFVERLIEQAVKDRAARRLLKGEWEDLEDEAVSFIADMPVWEEVE